MRRPFRILVAILSVALFVPNTAISQTAAEEDRAALMALYDATNGVNWTNSTNWGSSRPLGEWHGVVTDPNGRVTQLSFDDNQLTGSIPSWLGSLKNLRGLDLDRNQLTGSIPSALGSLTNLEVLEFSNNQLTGLIPSALGSLTNLRGLWLGSNQLTGSIPSALGNRAQLESLDLSWNALTGTVPTGWGTCRTSERSGSLETS